MTGLFLIFVLVIWIFVANWMAKFISLKMPEGRRALLVRVTLFITLLPLPLADEIVGGIKFAQLCNEKAVITIDTVNTQGKSVWFGGSQRTQMKLGMLDVTQSKRNFVDVKTQEPIYHYYRLEATGGWLIRTLRISEGNSPLLFNNYCQPQNLGTINEKLGLTYVNRPN